MKYFLLLIFTVFIQSTTFSQIEDYKINNLSSDQGLPTDNILFVYQDSFGYLWMASSEGLIRWDGYTYKRYYYSDGDSSSLAGNIVYTMLEDDQQRLWIGTIGGLNLYDRESDSFIQCKINDSTEGIPVNAIQLDSRNQLWLGTSFGLCLYKHEQGSSEWFVHNPQNQNSLSDDVVFSLSIDQEDNIWIGTFEGGVNKFTPSTNTFKRFLHERNNPATPGSNKIRSILADQDNQIWVGSYDKGVSLLKNDGTVLAHYQDFGESPLGTSVQNIITSIYQDRNGTLWLAIERGILHYKEKGSSTFKPFLNTPYKNPGLECRSITALCEDSFGNLWFASQSNGLFKTNIHKNLFKHHFSEKKPGRGISQNVVTSFHEDGQGNIWIGTDGGGLNRLDPKTGTFTHYTTNNGLSSNAIHDVKEDKWGNLWMGTWAGGIIKFNPKTGQATNFTKKPLEENSLIYNNVKTILPADTLIWIGTHGEGLTVYDIKNNRFISQQNNTTFPFDLKEPAWINHLFMDSKNKLWISTYGGLYLFDQQKLQRFVHSRESKSISSNLVNMVAEDKKGRIWVVSESGGLDLFDESDKQFIRYTERYELPWTIKAITFDDKDNMWLSSNEGIVGLDTSLDKIERYDESDGLQGNSFFHKAILKSKSGVLYFGGPNGISTFHPDSLAVAEKNFDFTVQFTTLHIYDKLQTLESPASPLKKVLSFTDTLVLQPDQSFFSLGYAVLNLYSPTKVKYAYKLEGLHDNWINTGFETKASFTNLDPGHYTFRVKYTDLEGVWHEAEKALHIVVLPPWWKTWWFKALLVISTISAVLAVFYLRLSSIRKQNKLLEAEVANRTHELSEANSYLLEKNEEIQQQNEKLEEYNQEILRQSEKILIQQEENVAQNHKLEHTVQELHKSNQTKDRFFSILAHDLRNPVSALSGIAESLKHNLPNLNKKEIHEYIDSIHKSSQSVYDLLINLLNWSRTQSREIEYAPTDFNVVALVQKNIALLEQQFRNKNIQVTHEHALSHKVFADYNMIDAVIRNLLSNSIKFTHFGGAVKVICEEAEGMVVVKVQDNGVGISAGQLKNLFNIERKHLSKGTAGESGTGLGLVITKEFIEANKGTISLSTEEGKGTTFSVSLQQSIAKIQDAPVAELESPGAGEAPQTAIAEDFPIDKLIKIKGKRILIIDDNKELRTYLRLNLSRTFEIFEAENGNEGLKKALEIQPTVIITDMMMPVMDGKQFCREVKRLPATSHIPVILLTSQTHEEGELLAYGAGADVYLTKPVKKELLFQVIYNLIQNQEKIHHRILNSNNFYPEDVAMNKVDEEFLNQAIHIIEENLSDPNFDSKLICDQTALSRSVLYAKIKTLTGQGVHEFIKSIRLKKSLNLLMEGKLNVSQIAFEVGFNSHSYFNKCFIKQYNMTPKEWVKQHQKVQMVEQ